MILGWAAWCPAAESFSLSWGPDSVRAAVNVRVNRPPGPWLRLVFFGERILGFRVAILIATNDPVDVSGPVAVPRGPQDLGLLDRMQFVVAFVEAVVDVSCVVDPAARHPQDGSSGSLGVIDLDARQSGVA